MLPFFQLGIKDKFMEFQVVAHLDQDQLGFILTSLDCALGSYILLHFTDENRTCPYFVLKTTSQALPLHAAENYSDLFYAAFILILNALQDWEPR